MRKINISDFVFALLVLSIAMSGIFSADPQRQIGALAAALGVTILWIVFSATYQRRWWRNLLECLGGGLAYHCGNPCRPIAVTRSLSMFFLWGHYYCPYCKIFFKKVVPIRDLCDIP